MSRTLGIGLGIDFARIDKDLNTVADKIEAVGKKASIKIGASGGGGGSAKLDTGDIAASVGQLGVRLSEGIAGGVRSASTLMLGFAVHVDGILNRVGGAAVTLFQRIDAAMKFPQFDAFFRGASAKLGNFAAFWRKPLSDIDLATAGAFGGMVAKIARLFKELADRLAAAIADGVKRGVGTGEASVAGLLGGAGKSPSPQRFPMGAGGLNTSVPGPRIGARTNFTAAESPIPLDIWPKIRAEAAATGKALVFLGLLPVRVGSAFASMGLGMLGTFNRVGNFLSSLGSVAGKTFDQIYKGGIRIATLGVFGNADAQAKGFNSTMAATKSSVNQVSGAVVALGRNILVAFGVVGVLYKVVQFFKDGIKGASDLNETVKVSKGIFGDSFGAVEAQANATSKKFGVMRNDQLKVANQFGAMAQGAGLIEKASASLANSMTTLTLDFAATWQIPFTEAADKVQQGLAGQARGLKEYGVWIDDATVKGYALARGARLVGGELTKNDAIMARAAIVANGLSYATGAMERTAGGASAQFKKAGGGIGEFGVRIGELLLPAVQLGTEAFNTLLGVTLDVFEGSLPTIKGWVSYLTTAMNNVGIVVRNMGSFWKIAQLRVGEFVINAIEYIKTVPANIGIIAGWIMKNWRTMLGDMIVAAGTFGANLFENFKNLGAAIWEALQGGEFSFSWKPLLEGFQAETEKMPDLIKPALISVDDAVAEEMAKIKKAEDARTKAMEGPAIKKPGPIDEAAAGKTPEYKLAAAVEVGSKEASSIVAKTQAAGRGNAGRDQLSVAKDSNATLKEIRDGVKNPKPQFKVA